MTATTPGEPAPSPQLQSPTAPRVLIAARHTELTSDRNTLLRRQTRLRWLLTLAALTLGGLLATTLSRELPAWPSAIPLLAVVVLVVRAQQLRHRLRRLDRLHEHYRFTLDRMDGLAPTTPRGESFRRPHHPFEQDLNLLGEHSLFAHLPPPRTEAGAATLASLLLDPPPDLDTVRQRQQAVQELAPDLPLREVIALLGTSARHDLSPTRLAAWVARPPVLFPRWASPVLIALSLALSALLLAAAIHALPWSIALRQLTLVLALEAAVTLRLRARIAASLDAAEHLASETTLLREAAALIRQTSPNAPLLAALRDPLKTADAPLAQLEHRLAFVEQRRQHWSIVPSILFAAGTHTAIALEHWRARHGAALLLWLQAWARFDALNALAAYAFEHPEHTYPILHVAGQPRFHAVDLQHPLLPAATAVGNTLALGGEDDPRFLLISGSNMSGKSALLRALGCAVVLAYAGAPIPATSAELSLFRLCASITPADSLAEGRSRFLAELEQLRGMLRPRSAADPDLPPTLFLIDEILGGTNSADRHAAASSILRRLLAEGAVGALSTHDLALVSLAGDPQLRGQNKHMSSPDPADPLRFDFRLRPGVNQQSSAPALLRLLGL